MKLNPSDLIITCQGKGLKGSFCNFIIPVERMLNIIMGYSKCIKGKRRGTLTYLRNLIHRGLMYWTKV